MSFSEATDEQIFEIIKSHGPVSSDNDAAYHGVIGDTFYICAYTEDNPPEKLEKLSDYKTLGIELYYYKPMPPKEELQMDPIEFEGNGKKYRFEFNVRCFPHISIDPTNDPQFNTQVWSKKFQRHVTGMGYRADVDPHTFCEILRYCDKMARLKMFW